MITMVCQRAVITKWLSNNSQNWLPWANIHMSLHKVMPVICCTCGLSFVTCLAQLPGWFVNSPQSAARESPQILIKSAKLLRKLLVISLEV